MTTTSISTKPLTKPLTKPATKPATDAAGGPDAVPPAHSRALQPADAAALDLLRQVLGHLTDAPPEQIVPEAELASLQIDSLALAEMLFALEDRLGVTVIEPNERPQTVADVLRLIAPQLAQLQPGAAA